MIPGSIRVAAPATSLGGAEDVEEGVIRSDILDGEVVAYVNAINIGTVGV